MTGELSDLLGRRLEDALRRLRARGLQARVAETRPPRRPPAGPWRVVRVRPGPEGSAELTVAREGVAPGEGEPCGVDASGLPSGPSG